MLHSASDFLSWMGLPLLMCLVITAIHGYLGIHVLMRKVIFVDLAMAQVAALGATYGVLLGYEPEHSPLPSYGFGLAFTLVGAGVISITRMKHERVPQEALIGIVYATASAVATLMLWKSPTAGEHLKEVLNGKLFSIRGDAGKAAVLQTSAVYAAIGLVHALFRKRFFRISTDPDAARAEGMRVRLWDFLFYATFGVVITTSVPIAGVLLVFSFLVVPASIAMLFVDGVAGRIAAAIGVSAVVSAAGMMMSYYGDFPEGPSVVGCFAAMLLIAGMAHAVRTSDRRAASIAKIALGVGLLGGAGYATTYLKRVESHVHTVSYEESVRNLESDDETKQMEAIHHLESAADEHAVEALAKLLAKTKSDRIIDHLAEALPKFGGKAALPALAARARDADLDAALRVTLARAVLLLGDPAGLPVLIDIVAASDEPKLARQDAEKTLAEFTGQAFGADAGAWKRWWADHGEHLAWRPQTKRFE